MLKKISLGLLSLIAILLLVGVVAVAVTGPESPPDDSLSARWLQPGPYAVGQEEFLFIDNTRATAANRDYAGAAERTLPATLWYPQQSSGPYPLIVYSHGFTSSRSETSYLLDHLTSHGYVILAPDFPLTNGGAPGGANVNDVSQQPGDVSFLIDSVLALVGDDKPFQGEIDASRIGLMGLSLGGLTTSLATYHPRLRDPRVKAAVSIAGPSDLLSERFYEQSGVAVPFLMIAGSADLVVDHSANAAVIPQRVDNAALLTVAGGNHIGFVTLAEPAMRFTHNADSLACAAVAAGVDQEDDEVFMDLLSSEDGIEVAAPALQGCANPNPPEAGHPGRQHMITTLGAIGLFESVFADSSTRREEARRMLEVGIAQDFPEADFEGRLL